MTFSTPPRWDLTNVYPDLNSPDFAAGLNRLKEMIAEQDEFLTRIESLDSNSGDDKISAAVNELLEKSHALLLHANTVQAYLYSFVTTDSYNSDAKRKMSEFEQLAVEMSKLDTRLRSWVGKIDTKLAVVTAISDLAREHAFWLNEVADQSRYLMSQAEEALAAELNLSGANAWSKLQGTVTSQLSMEIDLDRKIQSLPMPAIINLRGHPDEAVRRRGYETELKAWEQVKEPLAAALNGVKGAANTLNQHRGRKDALHSALDINRIDRPTLDAMLTAMRESFPMFRNYFKAKAKRLGKEKLPWWDLFAPGGQSSRVFSFDEARGFIEEHFAGFSSELAGFAQRAFEGKWIDAEQRSGKRGGAFCMEVPAVKESRILLSFDGSLDTVSTLAHELGHAYHNECMYRANRTELQRLTPMTMAETASIMCETIVSEAVLAQSTSKDEELAILENALIGDSQVIVDIYSRFLFESEVFKRREKAELSADEFSELMVWAQKETYGDGLDEKYLQPYMWTWKPHYYSAELSFYNFPYSFGLLFGTGLYAIYRKEGAAFVARYNDLLSSTGLGSAADLAARFGIDIRTPDFWRDSLGIIGKRVDRYIALG